MKILAFTDPHGSLRSAISILELAKREDPDLIVCAGDFTHLGTRFDGFLTKLRGLEREVFFVPGNHETEESLANVALWYPFMKNVEYHKVDVGGCLLAGLPATQDFYPGQKTAEGVVEAAISLLRSEKPMILLSHYPPKGTSICGMTHPVPDSGGSSPVREVVDALGPELVISGHYHQDFGKEDRMDKTRLINPGPDGMVIDV